MKEFGGGSKSTDELDVSWSIRVCLSICPTLKGWRECIVVALSLSEDVSRNNLIDEFAKNGLV